MKCRSRSGENRGSLGRMAPFCVPGDGFSDEVLALSTTLEELMQKEVTAGRPERKEEYGELLFPALRAVMVDVGLQRMFWPEADGGDGLDLREGAYTVAAAVEQVAIADTGIAFLCAHNFALQALAAGGAIGGEAVSALSKTFCDAAGPVIVSFVLPAFGSSGEESLEWEGRHLQVKARPVDGAFTLDGSGVRPTCSGADADLFVVLCSVEGEDESVLVLLPGGLDGLSRGPELREMGLAASRNADIALDGVKVDRSMVAGRGSGAFRELLCWYYLGLSATASGSLVAAFEIIREWGDTRVIKGAGSVFKENPLTASLMASAAERTSIARMLTYDLAELLGEAAAAGEAGSERAFTYASMLSSNIFRSAEMVLHNVMELMASAGYSKEWQLERYWRDVKAVQCYLGSAELARAQSARWFYGCRTL